MKHTLPRLTLLALLACTRVQLESDCTTDDDCRSDEVCEAVADVRLCTPECEPIPRDPVTDPACFPGYVCRLRSEEDDHGRCTPSEPFARVGEPCFDTSHCVYGAGCTSTSTCARLCRVGETTCECVPPETGLPDGYGFCLE